MITLNRGFPKQVNCGFKEQRQMNGIQRVLRKRSKIQCESGIGEHLEITL